MTAPLRIVLADDSPDMRDLLGRTFARHPRLEVVAHATDGVEALERVAEHDPDILVLDLTMPRKGGLDVLDALRDREQEPVVVVLSGFSQAPSEASALELGAAGYIEKGMALRDMGDHIIELYEKARAAS